MADLSAAREHFDVCKSKRDLAVAAGAKEISILDTVKLVRIKKAAGILPGDIERECRLLREAGVMMT